MYGYKIASSLALFPPAEALVLIFEGCTTDSAARQDASAVHTSAFVLIKIDNFLKVILKSAFS